jgi:hypothetical protein
VSFLLTPVRWGTTERLRLMISDADSAAVPVRGGKAGRYLATVSDIPTGRVFRIYAKRCGLGCVCDAWAREVQTCPTRTTKSGN